MRPGEICAFAWEDIDLKKGKVHVSRSLTCKNRFVPSKTDTGICTITLLKPALDVLHAMHEMTAALDKKEIRFHLREHGKTEQQALRFVFVPSKESSTDHGYYINTSIAYPWRRCTELSGMREQNPNQSRHTYTCWSLADGANPSLIASQMGHEDTQMVYEVYSEWIGDKDQDQVCMLEKQTASTLPRRAPKHQ